MDFVLRWPVVLGGIGVILWWVRCRHAVARNHRSVLVSWTTLALLALCASVYGITEWPLSSVVPRVVPSYHFLLYVSAAGCVWFGLGASALLRVGIGRRTSAQTALIASAAAAVMVAVAVPTWRARDDVRWSRDQAIAIAAAVDDFGVSRWISTSTPQDAVVLYDLDPTQALIVGPVDQRTTVVVDPLFSNPYVDWSRRAADAQVMTSLLATCDEATVAPLLASYGVRYVVTSSTGSLLTTTKECPSLTTVYADGYATVLQVDAAAAS